MVQNRRVSRFCIFCAKNQPLNKKLRKLWQFWIPDAWMSAVSLTRPLELCARVTHESSMKSLLPIQIYVCSCTYDQQYNKQAKIRILTLHTLFKFVWGSGCGVKKNHLSRDVTTRKCFPRPDGLRTRSRSDSRVRSGEKVLFQNYSFGCARTARGGRNCRFQK